MRDGGQEPERERRAIHGGGSASRSCQLKEVAARHSSIHMFSPLDCAAWRPRCEFF